MKLSELKIAILSDFTIRGLKEELEKRCADISIRAQIYEGGYNQIHQEFLDENSGLNKFKPEVTFLIASNRFTLGDGEIKIFNNKKERIDYVEERINSFIEAINIFLKNTSGILVVSNLKQNSYSPMGINDDKIEFSVKDWPNYFNEKIKSEFVKNSRVRLYDFNSLFLRFGEENIINEKLRYLGDIYISPDYIPHLAEDLMGYIKPVSSKNRKCIVLDLDNTLWGGIVGEDGFHNIKLDNKPPGNSFLEFQKHLLALHKRGVILAVNSRNNPEDALKVIREHPDMVLREEHFANLKINWENKVDNLVEIAKEINIGLDSLVFIDDDPVNRELVRKHLPEVLVVDLPEDSSLYVRTLKQLNDFNILQVTDEDFQRGAIYNEQRQRNELRGKIENLDDFLKSLDTEVNITRANDFTVPRISQLTMKTNQFNLTARRYSEEDIRELNKDPNCHIFSVSVKDKFGDNGLTGVLMLKKADTKLVIDNLLLSCRIIGRNIENSLLYFIKEFAKENNFLAVVGEYFPTEKNLICSDLYIKNGFEAIGPNQFELRDFNRIKTIDYIRTV